MDTSRSKEFFERMLGESPRAYVNIRGNSEYPELTGMGLFFRATKGTVVFIEVMNLPMEHVQCGQDFFGFHIHEGNSCTGNAEDEFADTGMHLNPNGCEHPQHMGDLPALLADRDGYAWMVFFTDKFTPEEVKGKTLVVHRRPDDFHSQPSGDAGEKIACGEIN